MKKHLLITPSDISPFRSDLQVIGAFNPGATVINERLVMLVRIAVTPRESKCDHFAWLQYRENELQMKWLPVADFDTSDSRVMRRRSDGQVLLSSLSYIQIMWIDNFRDSPERWQVTLGNTLMPQTEYETYGIEDARCSWIDSCCYITYTSVSSHGASTSLMTTTDFETFHRHGVIFVCENKDVVLFPDRYAERLFALHRPVSSTAFCSPEMWSASSPDGIYWGQHRLFAVGSSAHESDRIGAGTPPVRFDDSYLALYHSSEKARPPARVGRYVGTLIRLGISPQGVELQQRAAEPILIPTEPWELDGFVPNVVFPTAMFDSGDAWLVCYGAADTCVGIAELSRGEIEHSLTRAMVNGR